MYPLICIQSENIYIHSNIIDELVQTKIISKNTYIKWIKRHVMIITNYLLVYSHYTDY